MNQPEVWIDPNCQHGHQNKPGIKDHEIRGPRAKFTLAHVYVATQGLDPCRFENSAKYYLFVNGHYIQSVETGYTSLLETLKDIAIKMNEETDDA